MDLKLKDVAELLNVSEATLKHWVAEGKVPSYRLNQEYRFSRMEIEDWLLQHKLDAKQEENMAHSAAGDLRYSLFKAIYHGNVLADLKADSKEALIAGCMQYMAKQFDLDADVLTELFMDREKMMPTGLGHGIAIPHTRDFLLNSHQDVILVVYPEKPLDYQAIDGQPVHTCFFLFSCDDRRHLNLLSKIAHLSSQQQAQAYLQKKPLKDELLAYIKQWESDLTP